MLLTLPVIEYKQVTSKMARNPVPLNHSRTHKPTLIYEISVDTWEFYLTDGR